MKRKAISTIQSTIKEALKYVTKSRLFYFSFYLLFIKEFEKIDYFNEIVYFAAVGSIAADL